MPRVQRRRSPLRRKVALLIETSNAYGRGLLEGIVQYTREHPYWSIYLVEYGRLENPPPWLKDWTGDGLIARIETPRIARAVRKTHLPVVDVSAARLAPSVPWVETDDTEIARLAAEHLLERGFKHFAFCGDARFLWSRWRGEHFAKLIAASGYDCHAYVQRAPIRDIAAQVTHIGRWLRQLPKPLGVMAGNDIRGRQVLDACRLTGLAVPDEVAVIGVDNDALLCELSLPALSSIVPNTHRTGYEAAVLLDQMMAGGSVPVQARRIAPLGVVARQSTDVLAIEDLGVAQAVRFIREHACEKIRVADLLAQIGMTRRVFEERFRRALGRTPREEILEVRLRRAKELLADTDLPLHLIAERAGFTHAEYLSVVFKRETGIAPSHYRAEIRGRARGPHRPPY